MPLLVCYCSLLRSTCINAKTII